MAEPARDPRYDILFEPVRIGPLTAKNRFFQVPHCNGMGYRDPSAHAEMRAVKAQGGWAVICTEQAEIHYSSEITPSIEARIWDDHDMPALACELTRFQAENLPQGSALEPRLRRDSNRKRSTGVVGSGSSVAPAGT